MFNMYTGFWVWLGFFLGGRGGFVCLMLWGVFVVVVVVVLGFFLFGVFSWGGGVLVNVTVGHKLY